MICLGIDIGGTKTAVGIVCFDGTRAEILALRRIPSSTLSGSADTLGRAAAELTKELGISLSDLDGCGVGIPGTVSRDGMHAEKIPNLPLVTEDLRERLEDSLGVSVRLLQDSRAAALGEALCGMGRGHDVTVVFAIGTGLGTGITVDGRIFHGGLGAAGELGHVPVVENGRPCGCGKRGCLEKYAAGRGLDITAEELFGSGATAKDLFSAMERGDKNAEQAIDEASEMLGKAIVSAVNLISPNAVLFSGGLGEEPRYVSRVSEYVRAHCYSAGQIPLIAAASLGENAPLVGAALFGGGYGN